MCGDNPIPKLLFFFNVTASKHDHAKTQSNYDKLGLQDRGHEGFVYMKSENHYTD